MNNPTSGNLKSRDPLELQSFTMETPRKRKTFRQGALQHFKDYCGTTSIHGFAYFGEDRTWIEIVWWIVLLILAMCGSLYMIYEIYIKWLQSPVIISFATKQTPIYNLPLPAITVCPMSKIDKGVFNLTQYVKDAYDTKYENETILKRYASYMSMTCNDYDTKLDVEYFNEDEFFSILYESTPSIISIAVPDTTSGEPVELSRTVTQQGLCYTFNRMRLDEIYSDIVEKDDEKYSNEYAPVSNWNPLKDQSGTTQISASYPRRALKSGINNGVFLIIAEPKEHYDYNCERLLAGYTVTLHYPSRIPQTNNEFFFLPYDDVVLVPMQASLISTSETVKRYDPYKRDCYFPHEKELKYFKSYTQKNCEIECMTNSTLENCGCVDFYMPREKGTKICGPIKKECIKSAIGKVTTDLVQRKLDKEYGIKNDEDGEDWTSCDCLALCSDITYQSNVEPFSLKSDHHQKLKSMYLQNASDQHLVSIAIFYFKDDRITATERNELYGPTDFISNFGGLIGLFTGFSILSCMEILYFLTLRIVGNIRLFGYWAGPK